MKPLWEKGEPADPRALAFTTRDDRRLDARLLRFDLIATAAHVRGLARIGVLDDGEGARIVTALDELLEEEATGRFTIGEDDEDGHTAIERALRERLGALGEKVHTGRSRNDQVLVALRLFEKDALLALDAAAREAGLALLELARAHATTPMIGMTHLQPAVPSSLALWAASFAEGFADARLAIAGALAMVDRSPLGAAAGFGVNLPLDREGVARELGFASVIVNPIAAQTSRGHVEAMTLAAAWQVAAVARRFAWDLSLFLTRPFSFVALDPAVTTGSSIMPNKKNPDVVELIRAGAAIVEAALVETMALAALPSGYHRDHQLGKAPLFRGLDEVLATARILPHVVAHLRFDEAALRASIAPSDLATDRAIDLASSGTPFREAYRRVAASLPEIADAGAIDRSLAARVSPGATADLRLDAIEARLR